MVKDDAVANRKIILEGESDQKHYNYFKFISVVPHIFMDTSTSEQVDFRSYSYAFTANKKETEASANKDLNKVMMTFEFSPVSMSITKSKALLSRFVISICAIVGGVFVVFGLINSTLLACQKKATGSDWHIYKTR